MKAKNEREIELCANKHFAHQATAGEVERRKKQYERNVLPATSSPQTTFDLLTTKKKQYEGKKSLHLHFRGPKTVFSLPLSRKKGEEEEKDIPEGREERIKI